MPFLITAIVLIVILFVLFIIALLIHNSMFKKRYKPDPLITLYKKEEFDLISEDIEFICGKDTLRGSLYYKDGYDNNTIVVFCHGMWSSIESYMQDIGYICQNGFLVLGFDYTGTNKSDGKNTKGFGQSVKCADSAINYIKSNPKLKDKNIYVIGHSWGGFAACNIPYYHPDIKKVVAMAPFVSITQLFKGMLSKKLWILIPFIKLVDMIKVGSYSLRSSLKTFENYKGKVMIVHSKNDHMVNYNRHTMLVLNKFKDIESIISDNKYHNPNYSDKAISIMLEYSTKTKELKNEELKNYKKNFDYHTMGELDNEVMDKIILFLKGE